LPDGSSLFDAVPWMDLLLSGNRPGIYRKMKETRSRFAAKTGQNKTGDYL